MGAGNLTACLALTDQSGHGGRMNPAASMAQFERACFDGRVETLGAEGCLLYGQAIIAKRDHLDWNDSSYRAAIRPRPR